MNTCIRQIPNKLTHWFHPICLLGATLVFFTLPQARAASDQRVTINLKEIPLRTAIDSLFTGTGIQYSVNPDVLNVPVTLTIRDIGLESALRLMIRQASVAQPGLTFTKDGDIFVVKVRREPVAAPAQAEDLPPEYTPEATQFEWERIPIQFNNVAVFVLAFGGKMLPTEAQLLQSSNGSGNGMGGGYGGNTGAGNTGLGNGISGLGNGYGNSLGSGVNSSLGSGSNGLSGSGIGGRRF